MPVVLPMLYTLEDELRFETPARVAAGDVEHVRTMPVQENALLPAARAFRIPLRGELQVVKDHLKDATPSLELAAALDPRFKQLPFEQDWVLISWPQLC